MDKFSLYDFLSYFLPGMLACFIGFQYIPEQWCTFRSLGEVADGLVLVALALGLGLGIHRISFLFLDKSWFRWLVYTPVSKILENPPKGIDISDVRAYVHEQNLDVEKAFEESYYQLELSDKIGPAKAFQSMYFFLRNSLVLSIMVSIFLPIVMFFQTIQPSPWYLALLTAVAICCRNLALFYRAKMAERILNSIIHKEKR